MIILLYVLVKNLSGDGMEKVEEEVAWEGVDRNKREPGRE